MNRIADSRVGVGVGILAIRERRILLGRRINSQGAGTWSAPGGRLEYGESIEQCARRELMEETGLELGMTEFGPYVNNIFTETRDQYLTVFVIAHRTRGEPQNLEPTKNEGWHWFNIDSLPSPLFAPVQTFLDIGFSLLDSSRNE